MGFTEERGKLGGWGRRDGGAVATGVRRWKGTRGGLMEGGGEGEGQRRDHAIVGDSILGTECLNESLLWLHYAAFKRQPAFL